MIEVNLHPGTEGKKREGGGLSLSLPDLEGIGGLETLRSDPWHSSFLLLLVVIPLAMGFLWYQQSQREDRLDQRLEEVLADSARLADLRALSDSLTSRRQAIEERIGLVKGLDQNRFAWAHVMDQVSRSLPQGAWLQGLERQSELPDLGVRLTGAAVSPLVITRFVRALEESPYISDVRIVSSNRQRVRGIQAQVFSLDVGYRPPPPEAVETRPLSTGGS